MQPNALLTWQNFIIVKSGCYSGLGSQVPFGVFKVLWCFLVLLELMLLLEELEEREPLQTACNPSHLHPIRLIKRGSQTACNRKLGYHDSCTLCRGCTLYPRVLISSLDKQLESLLFAILYSSFGVWPWDHYMPLQRLTPDRLSCFAIGFPLLGITLYPQTPFAIAKVSLCWVSLCTLRPLLHLAVL
jgi:hypothetical protein